MKVNNYTKMVLFDKTSFAFRKIKIPLFLVEDFKVDSENIIVYMKYVDDMIFPREIYDLLWE